MLRNPSNDDNKSKITEDDTHNKNEIETLDNESVQNDKIRVWLQRIGYLHYFQNFVEAGYESIEFIKAINNELDLEEIGIAESHRMSILHAIENLKKAHINDVHYSKNVRDNHESVTICRF